MEAEKEQDPFASIFKFCQPTASQEAKFANCPLAREFENFADSNSDEFSSSPDPTPTEPTGVLIVSPPDSLKSVHQQVEDDAVFHTPPEHHFRSTLSSSEDQNLDGEGAEGVRVVGVEDGSGRLKNVRVSEGGFDDQPELKKVRVAGEEFDGDTVPVGETEVIEIEENEGVRDTEIIDVDSSDYDEETGAVNLAEDSLGRISEGGGGGGVEVRKINVLKKIGQLMKDGVPKVDATDENHELRKECEPAENVRVNKGEKPHENSDRIGNLDSGKTKEKNVKLKCTVGNQYIEVRQENGVGGSWEVGKVAEDEQMHKDAHEDGGRRTHGKRIEEIDEFRYVGGGDVGRRRNGRTHRAVGGSGGRRQLPVSMNGNEKNVGGGNVVENMETETGLLDFLDVLKVVFGDTNDGSADVDFLETAKRQGLTFPRVRWWPPEGDDE